MKGGSMEKLKPILAIISLQFGYAGMYIITMVSFKHGMDHWVLATYRHVVATVVMAPFALIFERYHYTHISTYMYIYIDLHAWMNNHVNKCVFAEK